LAYHYFRIGNAVRESAFIQRLAIAESLCNNDSVVVQQHLPELFSALRLPISEKLELIEHHTDFRLKDVFPYGSYLSEGVNPSDYAKSLFIQPDLFIRLRPRWAVDVKRQLTEVGISYRVIDEYSLALPNGAALDRIRGIAGKYVVQDESSQRTGTFFEPTGGESWWDASAGAGGKSLLLLDQEPNVNLLVSDIRPSILRNLDERFDEAGI